MKTARAKPTGSRACDAADTAQPGAPRRTHEAETLAFFADLSQALAVSLDLSQTLSEAVNRVADFMQVEAASLFLLDPATQVLECRICVGPVDITGTRLGVGQGVVGRAVAENTAQIVVDAANDARMWSAADDGPASSRAAWSALRLRPQQVRSVRSNSSTAATARHLPPPMRNCCVWSRRRLHWRSTMRGWPATCSNSSG